MSDVDTSAGGVKRLADDLQGIRWPADQGSKLRENAAHTLRALLAERDRLREAVRRCVEAHETGRYEPAVVAYERAKLALNPSTGDDA